MCFFIAIEKDFGAHRRAIFVCEAIWKYLVSSCCSPVDFRENRKIVGIFRGMVNSHSATGKWRDEVLPDSTSSVIIKLDH
jgi:hypothetical protein